MSETIERILCPKCGKKYRVTDALRGKAVKCKACGGRVNVPLEDLPEMVELMQQGKVDQGRMVVEFF